MQTQLLEPVGQWLQEQPDHDYAVTILAVALEETGGDMAEALDIARETLLANPERPTDQLPGGLADDTTNADVSPKQLQKGIAVEMEHTDDEAIAAEIARDHLAEDPNYYDKLAQMEEEQPDPSHDDEGEDPDQRASAIADLLISLYGDDAMEMYSHLESQPVTEALLEAWSPDQHPRSKENGRFIRKNSPEAVAAAGEAVKAALKEPASADGMKQLLNHLNILTTKQILDLKKEHGLSASGRNREELVKKIADRLNRGRREPEEGKGEEPVPATPTEAETGAATEEKPEEAAKGAKKTGQVISDINQMIEMQADNFEKKHGWEKDFTRENFKKNWKKTLKNLAPSPESVEAVNKATQSAYEKYDIPDVPIFVRKLSPEEKLGEENAHWDNGFMVISDDAAASVEYRRGKSAKLDSEIKFTVDEAYPEPMEGIIVHELGHRFHDDRKDLLHNARGMLVDPEVKKQIKKQISGYATERPEELIAEAYTMRKHPDYDALPDETKQLVSKVLGEEPPAITAQSSTPDTPPPALTPDQQEAMSRATQPQSGEEAAIGDGVKLPHAGGRNKGDRFSPAPSGAMDQEGPFVPQAPAGGGKQDLPGWAGKGDSFSPDELNSVKKYSGSWGNGINDKIRGGYHSPEEAGHVKNLDSAIKKSTLSKPETLYRGLRADAFKINDKEPKVGDSFAFDGFASTSRSESQAKVSGDKAVLKISVPAGASALDVDKTLGHDGEKEVLLPRFQRFTIDKVESESGNKVYHVTASGVADKTEVPDWMLGKEQQPTPAGQKREGTPTTPAAAGAEGAGKLDFPADEKRPSKANREMAENAINNERQKAGKVFKAYSDYLQFYGNRHDATATHYIGRVMGLNKHSPTKTNMDIHKAVEGAKKDLHGNVESLLNKLSSEGVKIDPSTLADYPDLAAKYGTPASTPAEAKQLAAQKSAVDQYEKIRANFEGHTFDDIHQFKDQLSQMSGPDVSATVKALGYTPKPTKQANVELLHGNLMGAKGSRESTALIGNQGKEKSENSSQQPLTTANTPDTIGGSDKQPPTSKGDSGMKTLHAKDDYKVEADTETGRVVISRGGKSNEVKLAPLSSSLPGLFIDAIKKTGKKPSDYHHIQHSNQILHKDAAEAWNNALSEYEGKQRQKENEKTADLNRRYPGLSELKAAIADQERYDSAFARMMNDQDNDGARPPRPPVGNPAELAKKYPEAAVYLKAKNWVSSSSSARYIPGQKALARLESGENYQTVLADMEKEWSAEVDKIASND